MSTATPEADDSRGLKPFYAGFSFSFFNVFTWMVVLGTPMILLAEQLGASSFVVGLCYSFVFLLLPFQILATGFLHSMGYKRQTVIFWLGRAFFILPIIGLAFWEPQSGNPIAIGIFVGSLFLFTLFRSLGSAAPIPWLYDILPDRLRGHYFSTDLAVMGISGVLTLALCALSFIWFEPYGAVRLQFIVAFTGALLAVLSISRLPSAPNPAPTEVSQIFKRAPQLFRDNPEFSYFLTVSTVFMALNAPVYPFIAYFLRRELAFDQFPILYLAAISSFGGYMAARAIKNLIDKIPLKVAFIVTCLINIGCYLYWLLIIAGVDSLLWATPLIYFIVGGSGSFYHTAHATYLPNLTPKTERPLMLALFTTVVGVAVGVFSTSLGGFLRGDEGAFETTRFFGYITVAILAQCALVVAFYRIKEPAERIEKPLITGAVLRPFFRYIASIPMLNPADPSGSRRQKSQPLSKQK